MIVAFVNSKVSEEEHKLRPDKRVSKHPHMRPLRVVFVRKAPATAMKASGPKLLEMLLKRATIVSFHVWKNQI